MSNYRFLLSGNLGKTAEFMIVCEGSIFQIRATRRIRFNFNLFLNHVALEYHYANLNTLSLLKVTLFRLVKDFFLFPKLVLAFLLFRYTVHFETSKGPAIRPKIYWMNEGHRTPLWVSRQSQLKGYRSWTSNHEIEWEMFRGNSEKSYLLDVHIQGFELLENASGKLFNPPISVRQIDVPVSGTIRIKSLQNVLVDRTNIHFKDGVAYPTHNFDYLEKVGLPTSLISRTQQGDFLYPTSNHKVQNLSMLTSIPYSDNWYHFIVEGLGALLNSEASTLKSPVLVSQKCPKNIMLILKYLTGFDAIQMDDEGALQVEQLNLIQEWRYEKRFDFSARVEDLNKIRSTLLTMHKSLIGTGSPQQISQIPSSRAVYLKRPSNLYRQMINYDESIEFMRDNGVTVIEPSSMAFEQCCSIIHSAKVLIAETGAAMTNMILCQNDVKIIEINPQGFEPNFWRDFSRIFSFEYFKIIAPPKMGSLKQKFIFPMREVHQELLRSTF